MFYKPQIEELESRCLLSGAPTFNPALVPTTYECWKTMADGSTLRKVWDQGWEDIRNVAVVVGATNTPTIPWAAPDDNDPHPEFDTFFQRGVLVRVPNVGTEFVLVDCIDTHTPDDPTNPLGVTHNELIHDPVLLTPQVTVSELLTFDTAWKAAWTNTADQQQWAATSNDGVTWTAPITQPATTPTIVTQPTTVQTDSLTFDHAAWANISL